MAGTGSLRGMGGYAGLKRMRRRARLRILAGLFLAAAIAGLQYRLWFGDGSVKEVMHLQGTIEVQREENERLYARNRELEAEVVDLKSGLESVEYRARRDLGMTREDETFYQIVERR
jgi:cell division protein FtsB